MPSSATQTVPPAKTHGPAGGGDGPFGRFLDTQPALSPRRCLVTMNRA